MGEQQLTIESLTDEQWKQVDAICEQWLQLVKGELSPQLEEHVNVLYEICDLKPPKVVLCDSPPACVEAAIRDGIADRKDLQAARHVARFCAAVEQLNNDGLVAALGMLDVELRTIGDDESSEFQQEELN